MANTHQPPGVHIEEQSAFSNSVVPVPTAVPAFIGYTEKAIGNKQSLTLKPTRISSLAEYQGIFGGAPTTKMTVTALPEKGVPYHVSITESYFTLYRQMQLFFANGGSACYIVSVGGYTKIAADGTVSANTVEVAELRKGISPLERVMEPTMLLIPELVTIPVTRKSNGDATDEDIKELYTLSEEVLHHCGVVMRNRFAILDVWMDREKYQDPTYNLNRDIELFRDSVNSPALAWGAAYYPWLQTTIVAPAELSVLNIANRGASTEVLDFDQATDFNEQGEIVNPDNFKMKFLSANVTSLTTLLDQSLNQEVFNGLIKLNQALAIKNVLKDISTVTEENAAALTQSLTAVSPIFKSLMQDILEVLNLLPPSGAMAGIYSMMDNTAGVFQAPANVSVGSVIKPAVTINNEQQEDLNIPLGGKAVNAIRSFPGKGVLVWGARTLDGNSQDWRYISVRRTVIFMEQSIKLALEAYVFEPNVANTWSTVKAQLTSFLTNTWNSGALAGATPEDAFSVDVGLGSTMTSADLLEGSMRVSVKIAVTRPAEFIVLTFQQQLQQA